MKELSSAPVRGKWRLENGELYQETLAPNVRLTLGRADWTDYSVEVEFMKTAGTAEPFNFQAGIYLVLRGDEFKSGLAVHLGASDNREHGIIREVNNSPVLLAPRIPGSLQEDQWYQLKVSVQGPSIKAWLDQQQMFSVEDDDLSKGHVNLVNWLCQTKWRNLRITDAAGTILQSGFQPIEESSIPPSGNVALTRDSLSKEIAELEAKIAELPIAMSISDNSREARKTHIQIRVATTEILGMLSGPLYLGYWQLSRLNSLSQPKMPSLPGVGECWQIG